MILTHKMTILKNNLFKLQIHKSCQKEKTRYSKLSLK